MLQRFVLEVGEDEKLRKYNRKGEKKNKMCDECMKCWLNYTGSCGGLRKYDLEKCSIKAPKQGPKNAKIMDA